MTTSASPAITTWQIDAAHSNAHFTVRHMMISNVKGQFSGITGSATLDPADLSRSSVEIAIDVTTVNTQDVQRDGHLKSVDFFDAEKYPTINFRSTRVEAAGEGELRVTGDLTLHGVTKPVVLMVEGPTDIVKDPWGFHRWGASATTKINRRDFGLNFNALLETGGAVVGDEVKISLDVEFVRPAEQQ
jgi:polyisoprenoid-binding protein YceI